MPLIPQKNKQQNGGSALPDGAERLDAFMARANAQYYATHPLLSDFITAPEISQIFGELLGAWAATVWFSMGRPSPVILAEAGPGRGTLMADALRLIKQVVPDMAQAIEVHLIETSPLMRAAQKKALQNFTTPTWHDTIETLPDGPFILLANEFLDALPVRQFIHTPTEGWQEHYVLNEAFHAVSCQAPVLPDQRVFEESTIVEVCEPALHIARYLGQRLSSCSGAALFIDYGHFSSHTGDSLQALRHTRPAHPLKAAGEADLTTHVDFLAFASAAQQAGARTWGAITQGNFLRALGLSERTEQLAACATPADAENLRQATLRLVAPEKMGHLFRVLALTSQNLNAPPGFTKGPAA